MGAPRLVSINKVPFVIYCSAVVLCAVLCCLLHKVLSPADHGKYLKLWLFGWRRAFGGWKGARVANSRH